MIKPFYYVNFEVTPTNKGGGGGLIVHKNESNIYMFQIIITHQFLEAKGQSQRSKFKHKKGVIFK